MKLPVLAAALLVLAGCAKSVEVPVSDVPKDEADIHKTLDSIASTFNAGDYEAMLASYEDDVRVQSSVGADITSKEAWRTTLKTTMPAGVKLQMRFDTEELKISGDLAYERGTYTITMPDAAGAAQTLFKGRHVHVFKRNADRVWKGWRLFEILDQVPPGFVAPASKPQ